jgi:drug/metabolite transporter (DMT)-like permease
MSHSYASTVAGIVSCLIWSAAVIIASSFSDVLGPLKAAGVELFYGGIFLLFVNIYHGSVAKMFLHSPRYFLLCGSCWVANFGLFWLALGYTRNSAEVIVVGLINYLWPALTLILSVPILGKRASWILVPGLVLSLGGVVLGKISVSSDAGSGISHGLDHYLNFQAYGLALIDALCWALYSNYSRRFSHPEGSSPVAIFMLASSIPLYMAGEFRGEPMNAGGIENFYLLLWACTSGVAFLLWDVGMRRGNVVAISACSMAIPLISTVITATCTGIGLPPLLILAAAFVVSGSYLSGLGVREPAPVMNGELRGVAGG